jgi:hypothetical protein
MVAAYTFDVAKDFDGMGSRAENTLKKCGFNYQVRAVADTLIEFIEKNNIPYSVLIFNNFYENSIIFINEEDIHIKIVLILFVFPELFLVDYSINLIKFLF